MNWTGGRLQRHSNNSRSTTLSKTQKQNFAKSKAKVSKGNYHNLPFQGFSQFRQLREHGLQNQYDEQTEEAVYMPTHEPLLHPQLSSKPNRLDRLKRKLLDKADWAAVSASRPLQMRFTAIEELEAFGKRRRLTEADRDRLGNCCRRPPAPEIALVCARRGEDTTGVDTIGYMEIRENEASRKDEDLGVSRSSQPMLLDRESPYLEHERRYQNDRHKDTDPELSGSVQLSTSLLSTLSSPSPLAELRPFNPIARDHGPGRFIDNSVSGQRLPAELSETPASISTSYTYQPVLSPVRRFTIDDQVLAEREGLVNTSSSVPQARHIPRQSGRGSEPTSLYLRTQSPTRQSSASMQHSPWLPQPAYSIRRIVDREASDTSNLMRTRLSQGRYNQTHSIRVSANPISNAVEQSTSPVKIFGQSVAY